MHQHILKFAATVLVTGALAVPAQGAEPNPRSYFIKGSQLVESGQVPEGLRHVAVAVAQDATDYSAQAYLLALISREPYSADLALMESLHEILPGYTPVKQQLAKLYAGKGQSANADALYNVWSADRPDSAEPHAHHGEHHLSTREYWKALSAFSRYQQLADDAIYTRGRMIQALSELPMLKHGMPVQGHRAPGAAGRYAKAMGKLMLAADDADLGEPIGEARRAARDGYAPAMVLMGAVTGFGIGTPVDKAAATRWLSDAADAYRADGVKEFATSVKRAITLIENGGEVVNTAARG